MSEVCAGCGAEVPLGLEMCPGCSGGAPPLRTRTRYRVARPAAGLEAASESRAALAPLAAGLARLADAPLERTRWLVQHRPFDVELEATAAQHEGLARLLRDVPFETLGTGAGPLVGARRFSTADAAIPKLAVALFLLLLALSTGTTTVAVASLAMGVILVLRGLRDDARVLVVLPEHADLRLGPIDAHVAAAYVRARAASEGPLRAWLETCFACGARASWALRERGHHLSDDGAARLDAAIGAAACSVLDAVAEARTRERGASTAYRDPAFEGVSLEARLAEARAAFATAEVARDGATRHDAAIALARLARAPIGAAPTAAA